MLDGSFMLFVNCFGILPDVSTHMAELWTVNDQVMIESQGGFVYTQFVLLYNLKSIYKGI